MKLVLGNECHAMAVNVDEFFTRAQQIDPWGLPTTSYDDGRGELDEQLLQRIRIGPIEGRTEVEVAIALAGLVNDELLAYGTNGQVSITDAQAALAISALNALAKRIGVSFNVPFRNFTTFRSYWLRHGAHGSWQGRRDILEGLFEPLFAEMFVRSRTLSMLLHAPSPHTTCWVGPMSTKP